MLTSNKGILNISFSQNNSVGGVALSVGWKVPHINYFVLLKLLRGDPCSCTNLAHGSEITALCYTLYLHIHDKLMGDAKIQNFTKVSKVSCGIQNGEFFICVLCAPNFSGVRKVMSTILKNLRPETLHSGYAYHIKVLNSKPSRDEYDHCVNELHSAFKHTMSIIIGKIKLDKEKMSILADLEQKYAPYTGDKGSTPDSLKETMHDTSYPTLKAPGGDAIVVSDYLKKYIEEHLSIHDGKVLVHKDNWNLPSKLADKERMAHWAKQFEKVENYASSVAYNALLCCSLNPSDAISFVKADIKAKDIPALLARSCAPSKPS
jgi:hypothetical protein